MELKPTDLKKRDRLNLASHITYILPECENAELCLSLACIVSQMSRQLFLKTNVNLIKRSFSTSTSFLLLVLFVIILVLQQTNQLSKKVYSENIIRKYFSKQVLYLKFPYCHSLLSCTNSLFLYHQHIKCYNNQTFKYQSIKVFQFKF